MGLLLSFTLEAETAKPVEQLSLVSPDGEAFKTWRLLAQDLEPRNDGPHLLRLSISLGRKEKVPEDLSLAFVIPADSGALRVGEIALFRQSVTTSLGGFETRSEQWLGGGAAGHPSAELWLDVEPPAGPAVRLKLEPENGFFDVRPTREGPRFKASLDALISAFGSGARLRLYNGEQVAAQTELVEIAPAGAATPMRWMGDAALAERAQDDAGVELLSRAKAHWAAHDWTALEAFHHVALPASEAYEHLLVLLGRAALHVGDFPTAQRILAQGAVLFPGSEEMQYCCGSAYARGGMWAAAVPHFRAVVAMNPTAPRMKMELANALRRVVRGVTDREQRQAMMEEVAELLESALDAEFDAGTAFELARMAFNLGRFEHAIAAADKALSATPRNTAALLVKSRALVSLGLFEEALAAARQAIGIDPATWTHNCRSMWCAIWRRTAPPTCLRHSAIWRGAPAGC